tara:strand:+ start:684 stop:6620 length:5937 start_codon:yes stop_codon:yes gene_type:complete
MTIYKVQDENGKIHKIEGPEGVSESEILAFAEQQLYGGQPQEEEKEETAGFIEGLTGGTKRFVSGIKTGIKAPFTSGEEEAVAGIERQRNITEAPGTSLDNVTQAYEKSGIVGAVGEGLSQVPGALGEQTPVLASIFGGTKLGTTIAAGFARGLSMPLPPHLRIAAGLVGGMIAPFLSMAGSNMERKAEEDIKAGRPVDVNEMSAYATATAQAAVERAGLAYSGISKVLGFSLAKGGTKVAEKLARENIASALAKGAGKLAVVEGATEATQQLLERYYAGLSLTDEAAQKEYLESAYAAALLFPLGSYQRVSERGGAKQEIRQKKTKEAQEKLKEKLQLEEKEEEDAEKSINKEVDEVIKGAEAEIAGTEPLGDKFSNTQLKKRLNLREDQIPYKSLINLDLTDLGQLEQADVILTTALQGKGSRLNRKAAKTLRRKIRQRIKELKDAVDKSSPPEDEIEEEEKPNVVVDKDAQVDLENEAIIDPKETKGKDDTDVAGEELQPTIPKSKAKPLKVTSKGKLKTEVSNYLKGVIGPDAESDFLTTIGLDNAGIDVKKLSRFEELDRNVQDAVINEIDKRYNDARTSMQIEGNKNPSKALVYESTFTSISEETEAEGVFLSNEITNTLKNLAPKQEVQDAEGTGEGIVGAAGAVDQEGLGARDEAPVQTTEEAVTEVVDETDGDAVVTPRPDTGQLTGREEGVDSALVEDVALDPALVGKPVEITQEISPGKSQVIKGTYVDEGGRAFIKYKEENNDVTTYKPIQNNASITELKEEPDFSKRAPSSKDKKVVKSLGKKKTLGQVLGTLENKFSKVLTKAQKELLPLLMNTPNVANTKFKVNSKLEKDQGAYGSYSVQDNLIEISDNADIETILHEGTHAATTKTINKHINKDGEGKTKIGRELVQLYNDTLAADTEGKYSRQLKNPKEFVTEAINSESFQRFLATIPSSVSRSAIIEENAYVDSLKKQGVGEAAIANLVNERRANNESPSVWSSFVSSVKEMLGMNSINHYVLNDVLALAPSLFKGPGKKPGTQEEILFKEKDTPTQEELEEKVQRLKQPSEIALDEENAIKEDIEEGEKLVSIWDKIGTSVFSFDAALNNKVKRELMKGKDTDWEAISKTLNEMSVSQVLHVEGVVEEFLKFGKIKYDTSSDKFVVIDEGNASFEKVIESLKSLATKAGIKLETMREAADKNFKARRAQEFIDNNNIIKAQMNVLVKQGKKQEAIDLGKENLVKVLLTQDQIDEALELSDTYPELNDIHNMWIESKNDAIKFLVDTEIMTQEQANEFATVVDVEGAPEQTVEKDEDGNYIDTYVPFYGKETKRKPTDRQRTRLGDRGKYYRLKGTYKPVDDVFTNMELWMRSSIKRGMLNKKALDKVKAIESLPQEVQDTIMKTGEEVNRSSSNTVAMSRVRDGVRRVEYYEFTDPFYAQAFNGMERAQIDGLSFLSNVSNFLRSNVVLYPLFSLAQLPQDSVSAMFSSGVKNPFAIPFRVLKEFPLTLLNMSQSHKDLKKYGAVGFSGSYSQADTEAKGEIKQDGFYNRWSEKIRSVPGGDASLTFLNRLAMASDNAVRQAVYEQTMKETNNPRLAIERAFEVINFKRAGSNAAVTMLRQTVPFFGAYLQAASVQGRVLTGRGISPQDRAQGFKQLALTGTQLAMVTMIYRALVDGGDDEDSEYQKLDPTTRDRRFLLGNGAYITLRPDMFTYLFKIMPENIINTMNEDQDNKKTWDSMKRNLGELANANLVPQAIRPIMNVMSNRDPRTGRPIIPQSIKDLEIQDQYTAGTSELSKLLSDASGDNISPAKIDYYLRQYLGYTGGLMMMFFDTMIDELDVYDYDRATKSDRDLLASIPGMSNFIAREYGNRHTTDYYEAKAEVTKIYNAYKNMEKTSFDRKRVENFAKDNYVVIQAKGQMNAKTKALQGIRVERRRLIEAPRTLISADGKKELLDAFYAEERELLQEIRDLRKVIFGTNFEESPETIR